MKNLKTLLVLAMMLISVNSQSQVLLSILFGDKLNSEGLEFGLEGGFNWSDISQLEANKRLSSFNLGFYFDFRLKNQWNIYTGVLVKAKLGDNELTPNDLAFLEITPQEEEGSYSQKINYFVVPALLKYNFKNRIYLEAGPQFSLRYKSWVEFNSDIDDRTTNIKDFNKDKINPLDVGITVGTGYKIMADKGMTVGVKYYHGFANVYKNTSGTNNSSWFLKVNIPIGAHKDKEE
ncbi:porin family protein [Gelidibacter japonicus]|uniref:porin family protein n=1 Tax=Gelidibacter japonicus TaxID=1962232 RepID=UPI0013D2CB02|nr:porin family protein [Gelidibacter japonicus]